MLFLCFECFSENMAIKLCCTPGAKLCYTADGHNSADDAFAAEFLADLLSMHAELPVRRVFSVFSENMAIKLCYTLFCNYSFGKIIDYGGHVWRFANGRRPCKKRLCFKTIT